MATSNRTKVSGIYIILNTKNGRVYIGQTQDFRTRWKDHKKELNGNYHENLHLQHAWSKYGAKAFKFRVLEYCPIDQLDEREQHYLDIYMPKGMCYNIVRDVRYPTRGVSPSQETRRKIGEAHRGRIVSAETRQKMSANNPMRNNPEAKQKVIEKLKGKPKSLEHRQKLSEANKGKKPTDEARRKNSEAQKRRLPASDATRRKMSENNAMNDPEKRHKVSIALKGRQPSDETRKKMSIAAKNHPPNRLGKSLSELSRKKVSDGLKRYYAQLRAEQEQQNEDN